MNITQKLLNINLISLELRRLYLDLVFCYKVVFGLVSIDFDDYFEVRSVLGTSYLNPGVLPVFVAISLLSVVINIWNSLPVTVNF